MKKLVATLGSIGILGFLLVVTYGWVRVVAGLPDSSIWEKILLASSVLASQYVVAGIMVRQLIYWGYRRA